MKGLKDYSPKELRGGPFAWMARNVVPANLLMLVLLIGGILTLFTVKREVFPDFDLDLITVSVPYPGASPAEVEQGVLLVAEEAVRSIDGIKEITSSAQENFALLRLELLGGTNAAKALSDVKSAIDRVQSFPKDIERPVVSLASHRRQVVTMVIYGTQNEDVLRRFAQEARDALLTTDAISYAEIGGVREREISIEVPQETLRAYDLTLDGIARRVRDASVELPGGGIKTKGGEILLRTDERRNLGTDFESIVIVSRPDGSEVTLGSIATVIDGFRDSDKEAYYNGQRASTVDVFRVGDETPLKVAAAVKAYIARTNATLPAGVKLAIWRDRSDDYKQRVGLLLRNGAMGLVLVLLTLGLFLEVRLAFWVTMGIPISFLGSILLMPALDVSINMISLFGFIVTLGIVVDDAIVVGESIYHRRQSGRSLLQAAIEGVKDVSIPVIFSILTTIVAFMPLLFAPGVMGKFLRNIPLIVIAVLSISLIESLFILPAHLTHGPLSEKGIFAPWARFVAWLNRRREPIGHWLNWFIDKKYKPLLSRAIRHRYLTFALAVAALMTAYGLSEGGFIKGSFMPQIPSDLVRVNLTMPFGTPLEQTRKVAMRLQAVGDALVEEQGGDSFRKGELLRFGSAGLADTAGGHLASLMVYLVPSDERSMKSTTFAQLWRERVGELPGIESLTFEAQTGPGGGAGISVRLSHSDVPTLERAASMLALQLGAYDGVEDVDDGVAKGKEQLNFKLLPSARGLGLTEQDLGRQLRAAFFGSEAVRQQRGRDEVRAYVRLPENERNSLQHIEQLLLRSSSGVEIPLLQAATLHRSRSYTQINRIEGRRVIEVSANLSTKANAEEIFVDLYQKAVPDMLASIPGLTVVKAGRQQRRAEAMRGLIMGFFASLAVIYLLLAIAFRSYVQPGIIMVGAIPFGIIGAVVGHMFHGFNLSLISFMGIVALSGIVVNDSLVLIAAVNDYRKEGLSALEAVMAGATRRFRPILLTSLTTFAGLLPMLWETSVQARFLVPMAVSIAYGILFSTQVILVLVPAVYMIVEDIKDLVGYEEPEADHGLPPLPQEGEKPLHSH